MTLTVTPEEIAAQLDDIRKAIKNERVKFQGMDLYKCGVLDGRLDMLFQLNLIDEETYDELMALGEGA